jgi:hypothetical protein
MREANSEWLLVTDTTSQWPNHPVERTAHSAGLVLMHGSVPVGRRSPGALDRL